MDAVSITTRAYGANEGSLWDMGVFECSLMSTLLTLSFCIAKHGSLYSIPSDMQSVTNVLPVYQLRVKPDEHHPIGRSYGIKPHIRVVLEKRVHPMIAVMSPLCRAHIEKPFPMGASPTSAQNVSNQPIDLMNGCCDLRQGNISGPPSSYKKLKPTGDI